MHSFAELWTRGEHLGGRISQAEGWALSGKVQMLLHAKRSLQMFAELKVFEVPSLPVCVIFCMTQDWGGKTMDDGQ